MRSRAIKPVLGLAVVAVGLALLVLPAGATGAVASYTGCLDSGGSLVQVAVGDQPSKACNKNQTVVHFSGGDIDGIVTPAGSGLTGGTLNGTSTLGVNFGDFGGCPAGSAIRVIGSTATCEADDNTTYSAGSGLGLSGTTFGIDPAYAQRRVSSTCAVGSSIRAIAQDGTVTCEGDDDTTYTAGTGLNLAGTSFGIDSAFTQRRVSNACGAGSSIQAIAQVGTVTCETDDNTTYSAGSGLGLSGTTFGIDPIFTQRRVSSTCAAGSSIRAIAQDGTVTCESDDNTGSTYSAGSGLSLSGTTFGIDPTYTQRRVTGTCSGGQAVKTVGENGTVTCGSAFSWGYGIRDYTVSAVSFKRDIRVSCDGNFPLAGGYKLHNPEDFGGESVPVVFENAPYFDAASAPVGWTFSITNDHVHDAEYRFYVICLQ